MRIRIVLPSAPIETHDFERCIRSLRWRFGDLHHRCTAPADWIAVHARALGCDVGREQTDTDQPDAVVFLEATSGGGLARAAHAATGQKTYYFDLSRPAGKARLLRHDGVFDLDDAPQLNAEVFNRLSHNGNDNNFHTEMDQFPIPHTFVSRRNGLGPIDPFGFRIRNDWRTLKQRGPDSKLICFFGSSPTWGHAVLPDETATHLIEEELKQELPLADCSVLNFSNHGATVMDSIIQYLMFAEPLKPDVVVCHAGINDIDLGVRNDRDFVELCSLAYTPHVEIAAVKRSGADRILSHHQATEHQAPLETVVAAFVSRVEQFERLVVASGASFVFSLQPSSLDKREMSAAEHASLELHEYGALSHYERGCDLIARDPRFARFLRGGVNLRSAFRKLDGRATHFVDPYHYSPEGERAIAEACLPLLRSILLSNLT